MWLNPSPFNPSFRDQMAINKHWYNALAELELQQSKWRHMCLDPGCWCFQGILGVAMEGQVLELAMGSRKNWGAALIHYLFLKEHHLLPQQNSSQLHAHLAAPRIRIRYRHQLNSRGRKRFSAHQCHLFIILLQGSTECNQSDPSALL